MSRETHNSQSSGEKEIRWQGEGEEGESWTGKTMRRVFKIVRRKKKQMWRRTRRDKTRHGKTHFFSENTYQSRQGRREDGKERRVREKTDRTFTATVFKLAVKIQQPASLYLLHKSFCRTAFQVSKPYHCLFEVIWLHWGWIPAFSSIWVPSRNIEAEISSRVKDDGWEVKQIEEAPGNSLSSGFFYRLIPCSTTLSDISTSPQDVETPAQCVYVPCTSICVF